MLACLQDNFDIVRILRGYEADLNHADDVGITVLHVACGFSTNKELMNYLVRNGADVDKVTSNRETILHVAALRGNISGMEFSISRGVDVNSLEGQIQIHRVALICIDPSFIWTLLLLRS